MEAVPLRLGDLDVALQPSLTRRVSNRRRIAWSGIYRKNAPFQSIPLRNARKTATSGCPSTAPLPAVPSETLHIQTHILSGWVASNLLPRLSPRERALCMAAAALPDLDGLGILAGEELYWDLHHKLGHNIFFFAFVAGTFAILARHRVTVFMACFALGWLHFVLDYFGSGPGWDLYPWWPLSDQSVRWDSAWPFFSWQNLSTFGLLLAASLLIVLKLGRTPLEWLMPRLDSQLVSLLRRPFVGRDVPARLE